MKVFGQQQVFIEWLIWHLAATFLPPPQPLMQCNSLLIVAKKFLDFGVGRLHTSYEAYMDAKASDRPLNRRASKLLCRPDTHGTILVMKTMFIKSHADDIGRSEDILRWEKVTEEELKSNEFKRKRAEWMKYH